MLTKKVFFFFSLEPVFFYLFVNFIDLVFNNFNLNEKMLESTNEEFRNIETVLLILVNNMNRFLLFLGVITYFIYIFF